MIRWANLSGFLATRLKSSRNVLKPFFFGRFIIMDQVVRSFFSVPQSVPSASFVRHGRQRWWWWWWWLYSVGSDGKNRVLVLGFLLPRIGGRTCRSIKIDWCRKPKICTKWLYHKYWLLLTTPNCSGNNLFLPIWQDQPINRIGLSFYSATGESGSILDVLQFVVNISILCSTICLNDARVKEPLFNVYGMPTTQSSTR